MNRVGLAIVGGYIGAAWKLAMILGTSAPKCGCWSVCAEGFLGDPHVILIQHLIITRVSAAIPQHHQLPAPGRHFSICVNYILVFTISE
jgi:hypothetical protein